MIKNNKGTLLVTSLIMLLPMLVGLLLWNQLPEQVPSHWGINGEVDGWCSKPFAVFGLPAMLLGIHWVCVLANCADPKAANYTPKMFILALWICPVLSLVLNSMVFAAALGYTVSIEIIMPLLSGLLFIIIGNLLPKCRQTYTMGIKLPWTLASEENWNMTHRFGGKVWVMGGAVIMATAVLGNFWIMMIVTAVMAILPTVYSYVYYRKHSKNSEGN